MDNGHGHTHIRLMAGGFSQIFHQNCCRPNVRLNVFVTPHFRMFCILSKCIFGMEIEIEFRLKGEAR